ncbi:metalloprotease [Coemansia sp. RSA 2681]|nr:metalloprotease [Coemansia sp. RSA 2681]
MQEKLQASNLHRVDSINNCKPADWQTGFEAKLSTESSMPYEEYTGQIEKSGNDKRQYRLVRLPNNLVALCIQDDDAKEAAVSLNVNIGSSANPIELQGLAHFLEHMLHLGTSKYPNVLEYKAFLAKNSGALDRFAQFFIAPLFNADCVDRELKAVDSEYKMNVQNDGWRIYQLDARTSNPEHPYSHFPTGNMQTLRDAAKEQGLDLREELIKFYEKYYSADIMRLVVVGNYSLDVLTELVASKFSAVKSKGYTTPKFDSIPLGKAELGKLIRYKTVGERYELKMQFALPEIKSIYKERPFDYINSLLATGISASSSGSYYDGFGTFSIAITATPKGLENYEAIVSIIFSYINMLIEKGPQEWYYQELSLISKAKFDYKSKEGAQIYVRTISGGTHNQFVSPQHILSHENLLRGYDADLISKCLSYLNPGNYRLFIGAQEHKSVECTLEEKHYKILHHISDLPSHMTLGVNRSPNVAKLLHLPGRNSFLPSDLSVSKPTTIADSPALEPVLLIKSDKLEVWFKKDDQFFTPHGSIGLAISSQVVDNSPINWVLSSLFCKLASANLEEELFSAKLANSKFSISLGTGSINVGVSGFSSRLPLLLKTVLQKLKALDVDEQGFSVHLAEIERIILNQRQDNPMNRLYAQMDAINLLPKHDLDMLEEAIKSVTLDALQVHKKSLFGKAYTKMLMSGNYAQEEALDTSTQILDILQLQTMPRYLINTRRSLNIEPGYYIQNVPTSDQKGLNSAVVCTFYCGSVNDTRDAVTLQVLKPLTHAAFFAQLRTSEQLGYRVRAVLDSPNGGRDMLTFAVEGESNPVYVTQRINYFIRQYRQKLQDLTVEEFESSVQSQINLKQEKLKSIDAEFSRHWSRIKSGKYNFNSLSDDIEQLKQLCKEDLLSFWDKYVNENTAPGYTRIDLQMWSASIWQPSAEEFEMYPSAVIALYGCLRSSGHTELSIAEVQAFVLTAAASGNSDAELLLAELGSLYSSKQNPSTVVIDGVETPKAIFESASKIVNALQMAVSSADNAPKFAALSKTNFAAIDMKQSPEGIWLINDYTQFKNTQALYGLPILARKLVPLISEPAQAKGE